MFEGFFSKPRAEHQAAKMQEKIKEAGITKPTPEDYEKAEAQVEQDIANREAVARSERTYSVDEAGMILTPEERKHRIEEGPEAHNK